MRRQALQQARNVLQSQTTTPQISRAPYICASCLASRRPQRTNHRAPGRTFTSATPILRQEQAPQAQQRQDEQPQRAQQQPTHYDLFPTTFPSGPGAFTPNLQTLRREYLQLQSKHHPDLSSSAQKPRAEALSALINTAYKTLSDPLARAQYYLLTYHDLDASDEAAKLDGAEGDADLLMEVMEAREAVDEVETEEDLVGIREENERRIKESVGRLEEMQEAGDVEGMKREAVRLRYWYNIAESIQGWEKGSGGGVIHH